MDITLAPRISRETAGSGTSQLWAQMLALCKTEGVMDLGQGAPNFHGSLVARQVAAELVLNDASWQANQYSPIGGHPTLNNALAKYYGKLYPEAAPLDPVKHIAVTCSATEGLYATCQAFCAPGDRAIMFEPAFPWYMPAIRLSGATPLVLRLEAPSFGLPYQALAEALHEDADKQTIKMVLFNMPQNPTGAVYSRQELQQLVDLVIKTHPRCVFVSDEAYEGQAFAPHQHIRLSTLEHAAERTVVLGTASKLLSLTGWRVGWMISHNEKLIGACRALHAYATFCAPVPFQLGVAAALESDVIGDKTHTSDATLLMQDNAVMLQAALEAQGLQVLAPPKGGYFLVADVSTTGLNDTDFCKQLVKHARVGGVPLTVFYEGAVNPPNSLVRFAVCKTNATMVEVCKRLSECVSMTSEQFKA